MSDWTKPLMPYSVTKQNKTLHEVTTMTEDKKQPKSKLSLGGVRITEWENDGENGKYSTFSVERSYKDEKTGEWKTTNSYSTGHLSRLHTLIGEALASQVKKD